MNDQSTSLSELKQRLAVFNAERGWGQFHTPRDLAMALSVEANELLELFLWKGAEELPPRERLAEEMADVLICLSNLARTLDLDLLAATEAKMAKNAAKYPVALAHGRATKYTELARELNGEPNGDDGKDDAPASG